jgi:HEAT repeat protein
MIPPGFTEETWQVAERFAESIGASRSLDQGLDLDEVQIKAEEAMRVERASRKPSPLGLGQ